MKNEPPQSARLTPRASKELDRIKAKTRMTKQAIVELSIVSFHAELTKLKRTK